MSGAVGTVTGMLQQPGPRVTEGFVPLTGDQAAQVLHGVAVPAVPANPGQPGPGKVVPARGGLLTEDWPLDEAVAFVQDAQMVGWHSDLLFRHDLVAFQDGLVIRFAAKRPSFPHLA